MLLHGGPLTLIPLLAEEPGHFLDNGPDANLDLISNPPMEKSHGTHPEKRSTH